jgi:N utilization substance protein B
MGSRRRARELAMQFLYSFEINPGELDEHLEAFWVMNPEEEEAVRRFAAELARGAIERLDELDALIRRYTLNWDLDRIAPIDRACLRLALFEMLHRDDIPPVVSINEAVDIAKRYSTAESGKFVNGILDKIKTEELVK